MSEPTPAQIEAAALPVNECLLTHSHDAHDWWYTSSGGGHMISGPDGIERDPKQHHCPGRAAQEQPEPCCAHPKCPGGSICCCQQPAPEADEREALAWKMAVEAYPTEHVGYDMPVPSGCQCDECYRREAQRDAYVAGYLARRSQPAPRTVSAAEEVALAHAINPAAFDDGPWFNEHTRSAQQDEALRQARWFVTHGLAALGITVEAPRG